MKNKFRIAMFFVLIALTVTIFCSCTQNAVSSTSSEVYSYEEKDLIGEDKAKNIALQNEGLKENDVVFTKVRLQDDKPPFYAIEFKNEKYSYIYEVNGLTGEFIKTQRDSLNSSQGETSYTGNFISLEEAKIIAFKKAGVKEEEITDLKTSVSFDVNEERYILSFNKKDINYNYEINSKTGDILKDYTENVE